MNKTLRELNLCGVRGLDEAGAVALAGAVATSKVLTALNLAFVKLSDKAVDALVQVGVTVWRCLIWGWGAGEGPMCLSGGSPEYRAVCLFQGVCEVEVDGAG